MNSLDRVRVHGSCLVIKSIGHIRCSPIIEIGSCLLLQNITTNNNKNNNKSHSASHVKLLPIAKYTGDRSIRSCMCNPAVFCVFTVDCLPRTEQNWIELQIVHYNLEIAVIEIKIMGKRCTKDQRLVEVNRSYELNFVCERILGHFPKGSLFSDAMGIEGEFKLKKYTVVRIMAAMCNKIRFNALRHIKRNPNLRRRPQRGIKEIGW